MQKDMAHNRNRQRTISRGTLGENPRLNESIHSFGRSERIFQPSILNNSQYVIDQQDETDLCNDSLNLNLNMSAVSGSQTCQFGLIKRTELCCRTFFTENEVIPQPESLTYEFKYYTFPLCKMKSEKLMKTVCAFLNCRGGYIFIGIAENIDTKEHKVKGGTYNEGEKEEILKVLRKHAESIEPEILLCRKMEICFVPIKSSIYPYAFLSGRFVIKVKIYPGAQDQLYTVRTEDDQIFACMRTENQVLAYNAKTEIRKLLYVQKDRAKNPSYQEKSFLKHQCRKPEEGMRLFSEENRMLPKSKNKRVDIDEVEQKNVVNPITRDRRRRNHVVISPSLKQQVQKKSVDTNHQAQQSEPLTSRTDSQSAQTSFIGMDGKKVKRSKKKSKRSQRIQQVSKQSSLDDKSIDKNWKNQKNSNASVEKHNGDKGSKQKRSSADMQKSYYQSSSKNKNNSFVSNNHFEVSPKPAPSKQKQAPHQEKPTSDSKRASQIKQNSNNKKSIETKMSHLSKHIKNIHLISPEILKDLTSELLTLNHNNHKIFAFAGFSKNRSEIILNEFSKIDQSEYLEFMNLLVYRFNKNTDQNQIRIALTKALANKGESNAKGPISRNTIQYTNTETKRTSLLLNESVREVSPAQQQPPKKKALRIIFKLTIKLKILQYNTLTQPQLSTLKKTISLVQSLAQKKNPIWNFLWEERNPEPTNTKEFEFANIFYSLLAYLELEKDGMNVIFC